MLGKMYAETGMFAEALDQLQWSLSASDVETGSATEAQEVRDSDKLLSMWLVMSAILSACRRSIE